MLSIEQRVYNANGLMLEALKKGIFQASDICLLTSCFPAFDFCHLASAFRPQASIF